MNSGKIAVGMCVAAAMFVAGYMSHGHSTPATSASAAKPAYSCPMHPQYKSDRPGNCLGCGMRLEPVYARPAASLWVPAGAVQVSPAQQQLIGVRTDVAQRSSESSVLRVSGRIAPDDSRVFRLVAATDGWVRELGNNPAGTRVEAHQTLASYFVRDLVSAQQNYLYAYTTATAQPNQANVVPQRNSAALNLRLALDALRSLGMTDAEIEELQRKNQPSTELHLYSPAAGRVLARNISPGQRFDKGAELYRIADLSRVWVLADVFEKDRDFIKPGTRATVRYRGREFTARLSDALPQFDPQSRNAKTRFELDNPGYLLWPDMFVDVEIQVRTPDGIAVPADAVIDSGRQKTVYVESGDGSFLARQVETGWRLGDRVQITSGIEAGQRIVVAGNFLIDSESRMKTAPAAAPMLAATPSADKDPVCGMPVNGHARDAVRNSHAGKTYVFCSEKCRKTFDAAPEKYAKDAAPARETRGTE